MGEKFVKALRTRDFWVEYFSLYISIAIATLIVQMAILKMEINIIIFCLVKSFVMTFPNIILIMYGIRTKVVVNNWILSVVLYTFCSLPYWEISLIYLYKKDFLLSVDMFKYYFLVYFVLGLFIKPYLKISKGFINRVFDGDFFGVSVFLISPCISLGYMYSRQGYQIIIKFVSIYFL